MVVSKHFRMDRLVATWLLTGLSISGGAARAQDDIEEPAGDLAEAEEDQLSMEDSAVEIPADGSPMGAEESSEMTAEQSGRDASTQESTEQIGPVWESYNSNLKSVAQEVTKGIRVEDVVEPPSEYHYAAFGKPDPFIPPMVAAKTQDVAGPSGLEVPIVSPLQKFALSDLRVVGIWQLSSGERKALVMTPGGGAEGGRQQGIIVRNGDSIGNRAGKILAIGETVITVREFRLAADGTRQYEDAQMLMGNSDPNKASGKLKFTPGQAAPEVIIEGQSGAIQGAPAANEAPGSAQAAPQGTTGSAPVLNRTEASAPQTVAAPTTGPAPAAVSAPTPGPTPAAGPAPTSGPAAAANPAAAGPGGAAPLGAAPVNSQPGAAAVPTGIPGP